MRLAIKLLHAFTLSATPIALVRLMRGLASSLIISSNGREL